MLEKLCDGGVESAVPRLVLLAMNRRIELSSLAHERRAGLGCVCSLQGKSHDNATSRPL